MPYTRKRLASTVPTVHALFARADAALLLHRRGLRQHRVAIRTRPRRALQGGPVHGSRSIASYGVLAALRVLAVQQDNFKLHGAGMVDHGTIGEHSVAFYNCGSIAHRRPRLLGSACAPPRTRRGRSARAACRRPRWARASAAARRAPASRPARARGFGRGAARSEVHRLAQVFQLFSRLFSCA